MSLGTSRIFLAPSRQSVGFAPTNRQRQRTTGRCRYNLGAKMPSQCRRRESSPTSGSRSHFPIPQECGFLLKNIPTVLRNTLKLSIRILAAGKPHALLSIGCLNPRGVARTRESIAILTCHRLGSENSLSRSFDLLYVLYLSVFGLFCSLARASHYGENLLIRQAHTRRRAQRRQGPTMGRRTSWNRQGRTQHRFNAVWDQVIVNKGHEESSDEPLVTTADPGPSTMPMQGSLKDRF